MNEPNTENPNIDTIPQVQSSFLTPSNPCPRQERTHSRLKLDEIERILGKPDAVVMRESMARGMDEKYDVETRVAALNELRVLVENTDNANVLKHLQMYPELLSLLSPKIPDAVRQLALWIIGTVVENNPDGQAEVIRYDPLPQMLSILIPEGLTKNRPSEHTRATAASTLLVTLVQNACGVRRLGEINAWDLIGKALQDPNVTIRSRIALLIDHLLKPRYMPVEFPPSQTFPHRARSNTFPSDVPFQFLSIPDVVTTSPTGFSPRSTSTPTFQALQTYRISHALVESIAKPPNDPSSELEHIRSGYAGKAASALVTYVNMGGQLSEPERDLLKPYLDNPACRIIWGLDHAAWESLKRSISAA